MEKWCPNAYPKGGSSPAPKDVTDPLVNTLGNDAAYKIAKHATRNLPAYIQLQQRSKDVQLDQHILNAQYESRTALVHMRSHLFSLDTSQAMWTSESTAQDFISHAVPLPLRFEVSDDVRQYLHCSRYGTEFSDLVSCWILSLRWPTQPEPTTPQLPIGVTWFELAVNFLITTQRAIPIVVGNRYIDVDRDILWDRSQCNVHQWANSLPHSVRHLEFILQQPLMPPSSLQHVATLYKLGSGIYKQSLSRRPEMRLQTETVRCVQTYLREQMYRGKARFTGIPQYPTSFPSV